MASLGVAVGVGRGIGLHDYELGRAIGQALMIGLGAGVVSFALHAQHRALRALFAVGALGLVAMLTLGVRGRRTHLEPADREAPAIAEIDGERRLVHHASGLSMPVPYGLTPTAGTDGLESSAGGAPDDMLAWGWQTPGGAITWSMGLDRAEMDESRFREHVANVLEGARGSGMTSSDVVIGDRVARASCAVQGLPCRLRIDSFAAEGGERHWSSVVIVIQEDTTAAAAMLDGVRAP